MAKKNVVKRFWCGILSCILGLGVSGFDFVEQTEYVTVAHVYNVLPGTEEWKQMTPKERYASCYVGEEEVSRMTTDALIETVLNYPYFINIYAFDTLEQGIESVSEYCPGLLELLSRPDVNEKLQLYLNERTLLMDTDTIDINAMGASKLQLYLENIRNKKAPEYQIYATTTSVYTPAGSKVTVVKGMTWNEHGWSEKEALALCQEYKKRYPSIVQQTSPDPAYNCHSYAWYSATTNNTYWMSNASAYITDGSYVASYFKGGNRITYHLNSTSNPDHSGICVKTGQVISKWGACGKFIHDIEDCPYYKDVEDSQIATIRYWERNY